MAALPAQLRAVLFDVDGTLYSQLPLRLAMGCELSLASATSLRNPHGAPRVVMTFREMRETLREDEGSEESLASRQYTVVAERLHCSRGHVERTIEEWMYRRPLKWLRWCRRPGISELLQFLRSRGVRTGVLSDYPAHDKLTALGLAGQFDLVMSAVDADVGAFKPDPRGFTAAAARWGVGTADVLYVGDRADVDAGGAAAAGMPCAILSGAGAAPDGAFTPVRNFKELQRVLSPIC